MITLLFATGDISSRSHHSTLYFIQQGVPDVRLCVPHRGQHRRRDARAEDERVRRSQRAVLLVHRKTQYVCCLTPIAHIQI